MCRVDNRGASAPAITSLMSGSNHNCEVLLSTEWVILMSADDTSSSSPKSIETVTFIILGILIVGDGGRSRTCIDHCRQKATPSEINY